MYDLLQMFLELPNQRPVEGLPEGTTPVLPHVSAAGRRLVRCFPMLWSAFDNKVYLNAYEKMHAR